MEFEQSCPSCHEPMASGAVLCTACGFHTGTGKRLSVAVNKNKPLEKAGPPGMASQAAWLMLKPLMILAILGGVGFVGWKMVKWLTYDPAKHQREVVAKLKVGMTVQQVVDAAGEEPTNVYKWVTRMKKTNDGEKEIEIPVAVPIRISYLPDFMNVYKPEELQEGFYFVYSFFSGGKYHVSFTPHGIVDNIEDVSGLSGLPTG